MAKTVPAKGSEFQDLLEKAQLSLKEASEKYQISLSTMYRWSRGECETSKAYSLIIKDLKDIIKTSDFTTITPNSFSYIDLFAGIGGFRKAFDSIGGRCVFTSEWDKASRMTYQANYNCDHTVAGDIKEYTADESSLDRIPNHDLLVAGFPCQPFSIAGVSKKNSLGKAHGFRCDTQGTLFFDVAQIISHHRPAAILLENVKNLISHDEGRTFKIIMRTLEDELGYTVKCRVIDGRSWVPQHRERIFIVGFREDVGFDFSRFEIPSPEKGPRLMSIFHKTEEEDEAPYFENGQIAQKYTISEHLWNYLQRYKEKHALKGNGFGFSLCKPSDVARTLSARYYKDGSEILIEQPGERPRRLTPRECARLMGFDAHNESNFKIPVSDTQAYKQFGNSVVVPCATAIAKFMLPYMLEVIRRQGNQLEFPFYTEPKKALSA